MRNQYNKELKELNDMLIEMADVINGRLHNLVNVIYNETFETLDDNHEQADQDIHDYERSIESKCVRLIMEQQPVASDLRYISSALKVCTDLKRIGDQCFDIEDAFYNIKNVTLENKTHFVTAARTVRDMLNEAIGAFIAIDVKKAKEVEEYDDVVDRLFEKVKTDVVTTLKEDEDKADECMQMLLIAKHIEKIGDHVASICRWTEFNGTGNIGEYHMFDK